MPAHNRVCGLQTECYRKCSTAAELQAFMGYKTVVNVDESTPRCYGVHGGSVKTLPFSKILVVPLKGSVCFFLLLGYFLCQLSFLVVLKGAGMFVCFADKYFT